MPFPLEVYLRRNSSLQKNASQYKQEEKWNLKNHQFATSGEMIGLGTDHQ